MIKSLAAAAAIVVVLLVATGVNAQAKLEATIDRRLIRRHVIVSRRPARGVFFLRETTAA